MSDSTYAMKPKKSHIKETLIQYWKCRYLFILLLPILGWYVIFRYGPLYGLQLAFKDYKIMEGIWGSPWVGLTHFKYIFTSSLDFKRIMFNTIWLSFLRIVFEFPVPILFALLLNEVWSKKFLKITQNISYLPHFFSWVIMGKFWIDALSPSTGIVNYFITSFGFESIYFMAKPNLFRPILIVTSIFKNVGWDSIIYLAALSGIDTEIYDSAKIDGAGRFKQAVNITLPSILPVISIMLILRMSSILDAGFDQIFNMMNPSNLLVADILDTYIYRAGLEGLKFSMTTALGLFKMAVSFTLVAIVNIIVKKMGQEGLF